MEVFELITNLFFTLVTHIVNNATYFVYFFLAAWGSALIFNIIYDFTGGYKKQK